MARRPVAADVVHRALGERPLPYVYLPFDADGFAAPVTLVARTAAGPAPLVPAMRAHVAAVDPGLPVMDVHDSCCPAR